MIAYANIKDGWLEVYDENGNRLWDKQVDDDDQVVGSTATTVSVKRDNYIYVYDENGNEVSSRQI